MVTKRQFREEGHRRSFLAIVDDTPECARAVVYAARRAAAIGNGLVLAYIIPPADFQHWLGVEERMREEATEKATAELERFAELARDTCGCTVRTVIREGKPFEAVVKLIEEDRDIAIMVLAAGDSNEGPGPLVSSVAGRNATFPIPVTVVPATLTDAEIDDLV